MELRSIEQIIEDYDRQPQNLVEVLQDTQEQQGYISEETMRLVSTGLGVPLIEVCRVANFYRAFSLVPRGRHVITVCMGTACHVRGAPRLLDVLQGQLGIEPGQTTADAMFTLERVNCLGACALGPVVVLDGDYHGQMTPNKLRELVEAIEAERQEVGTDA